MYMLQREREAKGKKGPKIAEAQKKHFVREEKVSEIKDQTLGNG